LHVGSLCKLLHLCFGPNVAADYSTAERTVTRGGNKTIDKRDAIRERPHPNGIRVTRSPPRRHKGETVHAEIYARRDRSGEELFSNPRSAKGWRRRRESQTQAFDSRILRQIEGSEIGMEACGSAHYWARELQRLGHKVSLMPPIYTKR